MSWIVSLLVLSALIFFHELGHYTVARLVGVKVEVFSIGFGKKLFSFFALNTQWSISAIPLGGYVKMKGQDDSDPTKKSFDSDSYNTKTPFQKILILLAGPFANFLLAFFLYFAIGLSNPTTLAPVIGDVVKDSPAFEAGIKPKDKIVAINGKEISTWNEMAKIISKSDSALNIDIQRDGFIEKTILTPKLTQTTDMYGEKIKRKMIGISSAGVTTPMNLTFIQTFGYAYDQTIWASTMIYTGLKKLVLGDVPAKELGGVISIVKLTSDATAVGWVSVVFFMALISVNLGMLNLLPIPALDGGHIMFNLYEMITKHTPSDKVIMNLTIFGWVILFGLMALGLYNDISRLLEP